MENPGHRREKEIKIRGNFKRNPLGAVENHSYNGNVCPYF
jgi:hypothetical protein